MIASDLRFISAPIELHFDYKKAKGSHMGMVRAIAQRLPPALVHVVSRILRRDTFSGDYSSFAAAQAHSMGYNSIEIAQAFARAEIVISTFINPTAQQILAALSVVLVGRDQISILDVGGANGFYYYALRPYLPLSWTILETPAMVRTCAGNQIRYIDALDESRYDVVLLSGVLQYMPDPYLELTRFADLGSFLLINRLPLIERDRLTVQTVRHTSYRASYPAWFFGREKFLASLPGRMLMHWQAEDAPFLDGRIVPYQGMLIESHQFT